MTQFAHRSFSVSLYAEPKSMAAYCAEHGHTMPDRRGKCVRCGQPTTTSEFVTQLDAAKEKSCDTER